jgi:hypothetical protein
MTQAENSIGTILTIGVTPVGKLTKIGSPEMSKGEIDVTTLGSTGGYKEFISDFRDGGNLTFEGFAISDLGQDALKANFDADVNADFTITLPNGTTITFNGYVSKYKKGDAAVGQGLTFSGEIRVSGVVDYAEVASAALTTIALTNQAGAGLTGAVYSRAFAGSAMSYAATITSVAADTGVKVTATQAVASIMDLYVDGAFLEALTTATPSSVISLAVGQAKLIQVREYQTDKSPITYSYMVGLVS